MGVLEEQAAGGSEGEDGAEGSIDSFDLDLAVAGEGGWGFEREGEGLGERKVVGVWKGDVAAGSGLDVFAEQRDDGARGGDDDGNGEAAAVA